MQGKVVDRLFKAYFVEGRDIGDRSVLVEIAGECGLEAKLVEKLLSEGADVDLVQEEIAQAQAIGVSGVPFFVFAIAASACRVRRKSPSCGERWRKRGRR